MPCDKYKDIILTDYLDNLLNDEDLISLKNHFAECKDCEEFAIQAKELTVKPFESLDDEMPPAQLWEDVREGIANNEQTQANAFLDNFIVGVKSLINIPKPAYAFTMVIVLAATLMLLKSSNTGKIADQQREVEQTLAFMVEESDFLSVDENGGYDTDIENYFL